MISRKFFRSAGGEVGKLLEGVEFDVENEVFRFDFKEDSKRSVIKLVMDGPYQIKDYVPCTYFGYVFEDGIDPKIKKQFIDLIKYPTGYISREDFRKFTHLAVAALDRRISLPKYDVVVHPQSSSQLNGKLIDEIYARSLSTKFSDFELVKELPSKMEFNYDAYTDMLRRKPGVNERNIEDSIRAIERMMQDLRKLDYVKLGTYVKAKYRPYIRNFFKFRDKAAEKTFMALQGRNVLIVDDVSTTMSTIQYVLNVIRSVNDSCGITVFCLLGNKIER